jgi:N6-L-threonylcarbamoyladenine synthase
MAGDGTHDMSFSGLKTAVINHVRKHPDASTPDVAASFQESVVDTLVTKTQAAARQVGAKGVCLGGGVAANSRLRERFLAMCAAEGVRGFVPSQAMCTDNAAMVASAAWYRWRMDGPSPLDTGAFPNLGIPSP